MTQPGSPLPQPTRAELVDLIRQILARHQLTIAEIQANDLLYRGSVGLDSLDLAELSVQLELRYGRDPFTAGQMVRTFGELARFYDVQP